METRKPTNELAGYMGNRIKGGKKREKHLSSRSKIKKEGKKEETIVKSVRTVTFITYNALTLVCLRKCNKANRTSCSDEM